MIKEFKGQKEYNQLGSRPGVPSAQHGHFQSHEHISPRQTTRHCGSIARRIAEIIYLC